MSRISRRVFRAGAPLLFVVALLLGRASTLLAETVTATWNADSASNIAGYLLSYGTQSGVYSTTVDVGNVTSSPVTLTAGQTYYFAVRAYDTSGLVSPFSAEVVFSVPASPGPPSAPATPTITSLTPTNGGAGTTVTIAGTNFGATQGTSTVTFNGSGATPTSWSATSISVPVPAGATTGSVVVTVGGVASSGVTFTVTASATAPAQLTTPAPGSTLSASTVTFQWTGGMGVTDYQLSVGTAVGGTDLFNHDLGTSLSATVGGLPTDGSTLFVRLSSLIGGTLQSNDYTYTAATTTSVGLAQITTPAPGSTLTASNVTFQWTGGTAVLGYWLTVGSTSGGMDLFSNGGYGSILSETVTGLPTDGSTVFVQLWSLIGAAWQANSYTYTATNSVTGPGTAPAQLSTPAPGSTLTASTVTFQWTGGTGVSDYQLSVGSSVGGTNFFSRDLGTTLSATVGGLPTDGSTLFVRLSSLIGGTLQSKDYTYTAATTSTTTGPAPAQITIPAPGSTLTASTVTFQWTGGTGVLAYWLTVGSTSGGTDVFSNGGYGSILSETVPGLPTNGSTVFVQLWSLIGAAWQINSYTYTATNSVTGPGTAPAQLTTPAPGSTLTASTVTFQWTGGTGVSDYQLSVGGSLGGTNFFSRDLGTALSATVGGLPTDGSTLFVRLSSLIGGTLQSTDYTFTATTATTMGPAQMIAPAPGSTLTASTVTFQWTGGTGVSAYWFDVGTTEGGNDLFANGGYGSILSETVGGLPTNGSTVFVELWSLIGGTWQVNEYTYTATSR